MDIHNILQNREIYGHYKWSRDRYPRYWGVDTYRLGGLECFVDRLEQSASLSCHRGCVNTVRWNANGSKIVSGSDDCHLGIWKINFQFGGESKLLSRFETGHDSNIFHALFIPNTNDNEIISCALDCDIRYNIIDQNISKRIGTHDGACHKLDIINKNVFISCSEDGTIKLIDMRDKTTVNQTRATNTVHNTIVQLYKFSHVTNTSESHQITTLPKIGKEKVSCYTMTLNPLNNHILAVGCRDKWVRLYDRRTLSCGNGKNAKPYMLLTQHALLHKQQGSRYGDSEGVTGLAWSYDGQEIAASYSAKNIALFNLYAEKTCVNFTNCNDIAEKHAKTQEETRDLLNSFPNAQSSSSDLDVDVDVDVDDDKEDNKDDKDDHDTAMDDDSKSVERRSISPSPHNDNNDDDDDGDGEDIDAQVASFINDEDEDVDDCDEKDIIDTILASSPTNHNNNRVKKAVSKVKGLMSGIKEKAKTKNNNFKKKFGERKKKFHLFSKSSKYYHQSYESGYIPYSLQIANYSGHRTVETVKECNFFGPKSEYVISGSDCKHVFIWRKSDQKIVNILTGDARIANVVQGNPTNCSLVTSGLDSTVKLFTPTSTVEYKENEREKKEKEWDELLQENERDSERSRRPIPMSLLVYLLRRGLYGFDTDDDEDDEEEEEEEKEEIDDDDEKDIDDDDDDIGDEDEDEAVLSFIGN